MLRIAHCVVILCYAIFASAPAMAQVGKVFRIGFLTPATSVSMESRYLRFKQGLADLGYAEGRNILIEYRAAEGKPDRVPELVNQIIASQVELIVTHGLLATMAARRTSPTLPIICFACGDAVSAGLVPSLAKPGGNVTGLTIQAPDASGKRIELLTSVLPRLKRIGILWNPDNPVSKPEMEETEAAIRMAGLEVRAEGVSTPDGLMNAFKAFAANGVEGLIVLSDATLYGARTRIAQLAIDGMLPSISWSGEYVEAGMLMSFGPDVLTLAQEAAVYVDRILKGARPADLPIQQPTKFNLSLNLKTARALQLSIPLHVLARADQVIE